MCHADVVGREPIRLRGNLLRPAAMFFHPVFV